MVLGDRTVPEDKNLANVPDRQTQIAELFSWLEDRVDKFAKVRGRCVSPVAFADRRIAAGDSPTAVKLAYDRWFSQMRPFIRQLAVLERKGHTHAHEELAQALRYRAFVFTGEEVPVHETIPITVVIPIPQATIALLRSWHENLLPGVRYTERGWEIRDSIQEPTEEELGLLNDLEPHFSVINTPKFQREMYVPNAARCILEQHATLAIPTWEKLVSASWPFHFFLRPRTLLIWGNYQYHWWKSWTELGPKLDLPKPTSILGIMAMMIQAEQQEVIKVLGRDSGVATWQLRIPRPFWESQTAFADQSKDLFFFTEKMARDQVNIYPSFTSKGFSNGLGVSFAENKTVDPILDLGVSSLSPFMYQFC